MFKRLSAELSSLWQLSKGVRGLILAISLCAGVSVLMSLAFVWATKRIVDQAIAPGEGIRIMSVVLLIACLAMQLIIPAVRRRLEIMAATRYSNKMRRGLFDHLLHEKWCGRQGMHTGDAISRLQTDVDTLSALTCSVIPGIFAVILQFIGAFVFLVILNSSLAAALVLIMPVAMIVSKVYFKKTRAITDNLRKADSRLQSFYQESLHHRTLLSTLMGGGEILKRQNSMQTDMTAMLLSKTDISIFSNMCVSAGFMAGYAVTFLWSAYGLVSGAVSFGMMTAFLQLVAQVQRPVVDMARRLPMFINASVALERVNDIYARRLEDYTAPVLKQGSRIGLRFKDISYSYPDETDSLVIRHLSHDFKPGTVTGIIGATGAGKTTLLRIMLGLIEPAEGYAGVYGENGEEYSIGAGLRRDIVYVPQGNTLLYGTVRDNLMLGNPDASEEMMISALKAASADFVMSLPRKLDSECFEGGVGFSEGQAQRIAIARGLLKKGSIILLDEPTSSLDPSTEQLLLSNLRAYLPKSATIIIVTHRKAVLDYCTDILKL